MAWKKRADRQQEAWDQARLTVELVPISCWFSNLRSELPPQDWDRLRRRVYRDAGYRCQTCGGRGAQHPVEAHELWTYDDHTHIQRLAGVIALWPACHEVKHIGFAGQRGHGQRAAAHLAHVNGWNSATLRPTCSTSLTNGMTAASNSGS